MPSTESPSRLKKQVIRLSPELEKTLLAGVLYGAVDLATVDSAELSAQGILVFRAARDLLLNGNTPPLQLAEMSLVLTDVYGMGRDEARALLDGVKATLPAAGGAEEVVRKLRERHALVTVANAASRQIQLGEYDPSKLLEAVAATVSTARPITLADQIGDTMPAPPRRIPLSGLPGFSDRIGGGFVGLTVVSGEPAVGKSDLVLQTAVDAGRFLPVLYYDLDNGVPTIVDKLRRMIGDREDPLGLIRDLTKSVYLRDSMRTLDSDLAYIPPPALVVVDIFQALPTPAEYERQGLAHWIHRLGALRRRGYVILVVSEVARSSYGNVGMGAFKGSGEIEYVADLACQMIPTQNGAEVHVVKNRHGAFKGLCTTLVRGKGLLWTEVGSNRW
jgi:hypothetical protein